MEDDATVPPYPHIEPTNYDLIVIGTGLPESILAAAASSTGKSVLHLDPDPNYGAHFSSFTLTQLTTFLQNQDHQAPPTTTAPTISASENYHVVPLISRRLYTSISTTSHSPDLHAKSSKFSLDLNGPRVLLCANKIIDLIIKTGISNHLEFKGVDGSFVFDGAKGSFVNVPDSRSKIFKDRSLGFAEKNQLMRFFKLVQGHLSANNDGDDDDNGENERIREEDLDLPFAEFLREKMGLSPRLKSFILYAIAMADYDQDKVEACKEQLLKTKDGINRLALYHASTGRFPNAPGAMIYPCYGQGEIPQAFCRRAAVKGCTHVLRMPVVALLTDKDSGNYEGVKLASGQELFSHKLVLAPSFRVPRLTPSPLDIGEETCHDFGPQDDSQKVARGVCVTNSSLKPEAANCLFFYPPQSLYSEQPTAIRVFQLSSNVAVCPSGLFVVYISAVCTDAVQGNKLLDSAMNALFSIPISQNSQNCSKDETENAEVTSENSESSHVSNSTGNKPILLWSTTYIQELTTGVSDSITCTPMPDGNLHYDNILDATTELFEKMYPNEEFLPETSSTSELGDDTGPELES